MAIVEDDKEKIWEESLKRDLPECMGSKGVNEGM